MANAYARVIHYATSVLCSNKGSMDYLQLHRKVFQLCRISEEDFWYIVRKCSRFAVVKNTSERTWEDGLSPPDCTIIAKTSLRLCKHYTKHECYDCQELHLCKYFVYGNCRYGKGRKECKYSHNLRSDHNYPILRECTLHELNEEDLFLLLLQNDPSLLPEGIQKRNTLTRPNPISFTTSKQQCVLHTDGNNFHTTCAIFGPLQKDGSTLYGTFRITETK